MSMQLFPVKAKTLAISVTATSSTSQALPDTGSTVRLVNEGPDNCYVSIGSGTQTATVPPTSDPVATCTPVMAGSEVTLSLAHSTTALNIAAVCRSSKTATLLVQVAGGA